MGKDSSGGEDQDMAVGELLFQFTGQALLDFVEARKEGNRDEEDNGALAVANFEL